MLDDLFQYIQEFFKWFSTAWLGLFLSRHSFSSYQLVQKLIEIKIN